MESVMKRDGRFEVVHFTDARETKCEIAIDKQSPSLVWLCITEQDEAMQLNKDKALWLIGKLKTWVNEGTLHE
jgi:hypothetical protein